MSNLKFSTSKLKFSDSQVKFRPELGQYKTHMNNNVHIFLFISENL